MEFCPGWNGDGCPENNTLFSFVDHDNGRCPECHENLLKWYEGIYGPRKEQ
jgi:hypothetical protein